VNTSHTSHTESLGPTVAEWERAGGGCTCWVNPNPYTYNGIAEPGDALEADPECPKHFGGAVGSEGSRMNEYPEWLVDQVAATLAKIDDRIMTFDDIAEDLLDALGFAPWGGATYWRSDIQWEAKA